MVANVHDLVLTIGFMSLTQIDFDLTSIAALLTILGYSLNDTVVIYDRIREMLRRYKKMPIADLLNISVNSTLSRSVITHVTVTLALLALFFFGGHAIHSFTATMLFGVVLVGTYTSIFIAAPILIYLGVGLGRQEADEPAPAKFEAEVAPKVAAAAKPASPAKPAGKASGKTSGKPATAKR
jgi:preprotein translocase subunit SecF